MKKDSPTSWIEKGVSRRGQCECENPTRIPVQVGCAAAVHVVENAAGPVHGRKGQRAVYFVVQFGREQGHFRSGLFDDVSGCHISPL